MVKKNKGYMREFISLISLPITKKNKGYMREFTSLRGHLILNTTEGRES